MINLYISNKSYKGKTFISDLDIDISTGDFAIIKGKSGSGKSTLLNTMCLLDNDYTGKYTIDGFDVSTLSANDSADFRRNHFGIIFQDYHIIERMNVIENIVFSLELIGYIGDRNKRALEVLELVELSGFESYKVNELSGGQKQRVGIARAIAADPDVIFADEPTGNLDSKTADDIMQLLKRLNELGKTIILITHDDNLLKYGKQIITIDNGAIIKQEIIEDIEDNKFDTENKNHINFIDLILLGLKNLWRYKFRYTFTNIILVAAMVILAYVFMINNMYTTIYDEPVGFNKLQLYNSSATFNEMDEQLNNVSSEFDGSYYETYYNAGTTVYKINGEVYNFEGFEDPFYDSNSPQSLQVSPSDADSYSRYYLVEGSDPVASNEVVVSEMFIKEYLDPGYDIKHGDPSEYIGQSVEITSTREVYDDNGYNYEETLNTAQTDTFIITGVSISSSKNGVAEMFMTNEGLTNLNDNYWTSRTDTVYVPESYSVDDINRTMEEYTSEYSGYYISPDYYTLGQFGKIFFVSILIIVAAVSIIIGLTLMSLVNRREKEIGIYYALGLNQFNLFKSLAIEFILNSVIVATATLILMLAAVKTLYYIEFFMPPYKVFNGYDYVLIFVIVIVISFLSLLLVLNKVLKQDPIKIIRKV